MPANGRRDLIRRLKVNAVYALPVQLFNTHFSINVPFMSRSRMLSFNFIFPHQNPSHCTSLFHPSNICWAVQIMKLFIRYFPPVSCHFLPFDPTSPSAPCAQQPAMFLFSTFWSVTVNWSYCRLMQGQWSSWLWCTCDCHVEDSGLRSGMVTHWQPT